MREFSAKVIEELKYYVYALIDPRDNKIFYIGKGSGNRLFAHSNDALNETNDNLKLNQIRDIIASGHVVKNYILRHGIDDENEALRLESTLIDVFTYPDFNTASTLTNLVSGHHKWDEGIKSEEEIFQTYDCPKFDTKPGDTVLLVSLNRSFRNSNMMCHEPNEDLYEKIRKAWTVSKKRAETIDYVLGVYHGIVRSVIKVTGHDWIIDDNGRERCCFIGELDNKSPYLNRDVSMYPFGSGGAFRYIN